MITVTFRNKINARVAYTVERSTCRLLSVYDFLKQKKTLSLVLFCAIVSCSLYAQNLESIGDRPPVKISGGFNFNNIVYAAS